MSDDVYYIRTGDKISRPFKIGFVARTIFLTFIIYTFWITYQFFRILWIEQEIQRLEYSTEAKYRVVQEYDTAIEKLRALNQSYIDTFGMIENQMIIEDNDAKPNQ